MLKIIFYWVDFDVEIYATRRREDSKIITMYVEKHVQYCTQRTPKVRENMYTEKAQSNHKAREASLSDTTPSAYISYIPTLLFSTGFLFSEKPG